VCLQRGTRITRRVLDLEELGFKPTCKIELAKPGLASSDLKRNRDPFLNSIIMQLQFGIAACPSVRRGFDLGNISAGLQSCPAKHIRLPRFQPNLFALRTTVWGFCKAPPCHRAMPFTDLYNYCMVWHSMDEAERWLMLRTQHQMSDLPVCKLKWSMQGYQVCFKNFCHLIAVGPMTIRKHLNGEAATPVPKSCSDGPSRGVGRPRHQGSIVDFFFMELYNSSGEPLAKSSKVKAHCDEAEVELSHGAWFGHNTDPDVEEVYDWDPQPPDVSKFSMLTAAADGLPAVGLRERHIQHTKLSILYWQFLATWDTLKDMAEVKASPLGRKSQASPGSQIGELNRPPPCYTTFVERYKTVWKHYIKIRTPTEHAQCTVCFKLQAVIADSAQSIECRRQAAKELQEHHRAQYRDRLLYWNLRLASQCDSDVLVIIIDAMDKAKFAWPRWPWHRRPKDLAEVIRPKMNFTAVLAHGYLAYLFMSSEVISHGSDFCIEALARTIQAVYEMCHKVAGIVSELPMGLQPCSGDYVLHIAVSDCLADWLLSAPLG